MTEAAGPRIASTLLEAILERVLMLAETPGTIGTHRPDIREGIRSFPSPPFVLLFRYVDGEVQIVRILHERQDVGRNL